MNFAILIFVNGIQNPSEARLARNVNGILYWATFAEASNYLLKNYGIESSCVIMIVRQEQMYPDESVVPVNISIYD